MAARAEALGDDGLNAPEHWVGGLASPDLHGIVILFARDSAEQDRSVSEHAKLIAGCPGVEVLLSVLDLQAIPPFGYAHEHFGYRDRLSEPAIEGNNVEPTPGTGLGALGYSVSGAVNYTSVYYNDANGNRVVKGPLGIVETYKFSTLQGVPKVTEIDRAANGTVAAATETFAYDSNGYLNSVTDWNGNNTCVHQQQPRPADPRSSMPPATTVSADDQHHLRHDMGASGAHRSRRPA